MSIIGSATSTTNMLAAAVLGLMHPPSLGPRLTSLETQQPTLAMFLINTGGVRAPTLPAIALHTSETEIWPTIAPQLPSVEADRETTPSEHLIGEFRRWALLGENWDGEGAVAPIQQSVDNTVEFVRLLGNGCTAEALLNANGRAGLYWRGDNLYADLEFLGDNRIAYYVERNNDKHKGVVNFDAKKVPPVFSALITL